MACLHDALAGGQRVRILTVLEVTTRECVALRAAPRFRGEDMAGILSDAGAARGLPARLSMDNGTEVTSKALDRWAYWNRVE